MSSARASWTRLLLVGGAKAVFAGLAMIVPLTGVWIASSLAAHHGQAMGISLLIGALCFPIAPLAWEGWSSLRRSHKEVSGQRILTLADRMILRTLTINVAFVAVLFGAFPSSMFAALSSRGDWMLEGRTSEMAETTRTVLFNAADRLQWLHELTHPNAYEDLIDEDLTRTEEDVRPAPVIPPAPKPGPSGEAPSQETPQASSGWPMPATLHPLVAKMPAAVQTDYASVARYIAEQEPDELQRLKALHDYVADRLVYDVVALETLNMPSQRAKDVFDAKMAVCAGYSALLARMGEEAGMEIVVVSGHAREEDGSLSKLGHAWNAAKVHGGWVLIDATWDAGSVNGSQFEKEYRTEYFMTPPEVFGRSHFPSDAKWQLREDPLTLGEFVRQSTASPALDALGVRLVSPDRPVLSVDAPRMVTVQLDNPDHVDIEISVRSETERVRDCDANDDRTRFECPVPGPIGSYIGIFGEKENVQRTEFGTSWTRTQVARITLDVQ
ncbi:MAG: transglutaminase domain-containing protein [Myxococcota bacterium]